ncbi:MAG: hypothetical protein HRT82_14830 [Henriciella sp.]|nr:hypothetical protein [Henriciella sp.]
MSPRRVTILVAEGRHPVSGRSRRAPLDARAAELALQCTERCPDMDMEVVHAGSPIAPFLEDYLGMGLKKVTVLHTGANEDPIPALQSYLKASDPDLIMCGDHSNDGYASGLVPYLLAEALQRPIVSSIEDIIDLGASIKIRQALERGLRREMVISAPCILTVGFAGPPPRLPAPGKAKAGKVTAREGDWEQKSNAVLGRRGPAAAIVKQLDAIDPNASAEERLAAITSAGSGGGEVLNSTPQEAAELILSEIQKTKVTL